MFSSLRIRQFDNPKMTLDNFVFRLHYRVTVGLLLACVLVLLWKVNVGTPIQCTNRIDFDLSFRAGEKLDYECWYKGLHVNIKEDVFHPGLSFKKQTPEVKPYHNLHRWILIFILVQAVSFYVPRIIWKTLEGKLVEKLIWKMNLHNSDKVNKTRRELIVEYVGTKSVDSWVYAGGYILAEGLNLLNSMIQLGFVCVILNGYGNLSFLFKTRDDTSETTSFPLNMKCLVKVNVIFRGTLTYVTDCFMSVNALIEAIFKCQCVWFSFLIVLSALALIHQLVTLMAPSIRALRLHSKVKLARRSTVDKVTECLNFRQWFMLYMLSKNMDPVHMRDILESIVEGLPGNVEMKPMHYLRADGRLMYRIEL